VSHVTRLSCPRCGRSFDHRILQSTCACGSPLLADYDVDRVRRSATRVSIAAGPSSMWRYHQLLPVEEASAVVSLGEGWTPLVPVPELGREIGAPDLWVKDEGRNPTGTFKARGASCGISRARELGVRDVALPTAGNAGGAWACYGAAAGIGVHVAMPSDAPRVNIDECRLHGAEVHLVDGFISDAAVEIARRPNDGWFDVGTLKEPYRIEGKKTMGFEIAEQLGWRAPDVIVYPAGGGVGIIGIWRAMEMLRQIGMLDGEPPRLVITQSTGCAPLVTAYEEGRDESITWEQPSTIAQGLRVPKALGDFLVLRAVRETGGTAIAVDDGAILRAMSDLGRVGIAACPEGAATFAAARGLRERGDVAEGERVVLINTGTALKDPRTLSLATAS
jgi:threonine synthase